MPRRLALGPSFVFGVGGHQSISLQADWIIQAGKTQGVQEEFDTW